MKLRYKIVGGLFGVLALAMGAGAWHLSHNEACTQEPASAENGYRAITYNCYGGPEVLELSAVPLPQLEENQALVRVHSAAVNPLDWHYMRGKPYIMRLMGAGIGKPADNRLGVDFAGTVEAVGGGFKRFKSGDHVFGGRTGAFGDYVVITSASAVAEKPPNVSFEQAAAVPVAAVTALQALRDLGKLEKGQKVLINGASGGVGTFAVQIAKYLGAEVTGVCSTRNLDMVKSIGADHVIDYKNASYLDSENKWDLIIDNVGNHSLLSNRKVMTDAGRLIIVGGQPGNWLGPLMRPIGGMLLAPFVSQEFVMIMAQLKSEDLEFLADLMKRGFVHPVLGRRYALEDVPDAISHSEEGHARGKIIIEIN